MSEILKIKELVDLIPMILEYIVPGFIFLTIRNFSYSKEIAKDKYIIFKSMVISFIFLECIYPILIGITTYINGLNIKNVHISENIVMILFIIVVTSISVIYIKFKLEDKLVKLLGNGKTIHEDFLSNIIDNKEGAWIKVYLNEYKIVYTGKLRYYDNLNIDNNGHIVLAFFITEDYDGNQLENHENEKDCMVSVKIKDISRYEIFK